MELKEAPLIPPVLNDPFDFDEVVEVLEETEVVVSEDPPNVVDTRVNLPLNADDKESTDAIATKHTQTRQMMNSTKLEPAHRAYFIEFLSLNSPICYFVGSAFRVLKILPRERVHFEDFLCYRIARKL